jgi:hypothetical protein
MCFLSRIQDHLSLPQHHQPAAAGHEEQLPPLWQAGAGLSDFFEFLAEPFTLA